jgi:hypothetical protein
VNIVPEPGSIALLLMGSLGFGLVCLEAALVRMVGQVSNLLYSNAIPWGQVSQPA